MNSDDKTGVLVVAIVVLGIVAVVAAVTGYYAFEFHTATKAGLVQQYDVRGRSMWTKPDSKKE
jgi:hypothetical protein